MRKFPAGHPVCLEVGCDVVGGRLLSRESLCTEDPWGGWCEDRLVGESAGKMARGEAGTMAQTSEEEGACGCKGGYKS